MPGDSRLGAVANVLLVNKNSPVRSNMGHTMANFLSIPTKPKEPTTSESNLITNSVDAGPERPKSVLNSSFWGVAYVLHLVALGLTIAVLQLSFRQVYFADVGTKGLGGLNVEESLKAIQFAAKFHEIFMVASLAAIVSHLTRSCLLGKRGVPLGLVSAPFKFGSMDYICSREFFGSITRPYAIFSLGVLLSTIFALGLGPASAMALVPGIDWWNIPSPYSGLDRPIYVDGHPGDFWPQTVIDKSLCSDENQAASCQPIAYDELIQWAGSNMRSGVPANITIAEPIGGARRRLQSQSEENSNETVLSYWPHAPDLNNVSTTERYVIEAYLAVAGITTLTTTASNWMTLLLGGFWRYANTANLGLINQSSRPRFQVDNAPTYEPLVSVRCAAYDYIEGFQKQDTILAPYVRNAFGVTGFTGSVPEGTAIGWYVPASAWNFAHPLNALNFTWIDLKGLDVNASIGGLFTIPIAHTPPNMTETQGSIVAPCTVEARWIANELIYSPASSDIISDNVTDPINFAHGHHAENSALDPAAKFGASPIINITKDWADELNGPPLYPISHLPGSNCSIASIANMFVATSSSRNNISSMDIMSTRADGQYNVTGATYTRELTEKLATVLGLVVADGLSRLNYGTMDVSVAYDHNSTTTSRTSLLQQYGGLGKIYNDTHGPVSSNDLDANGTFYKLNVQRWGYGYGIETKASQFSVTMLLLYGCIVLAYIIWFNIQNVLRPRSDWSLVTNRWSNISEMLALAINSPPSNKLDGTCAGVEDTRSLKQTMRIREDEDRHLALVVGEGRDDHPQVQRDVEYG